MCCSTNTVLIKSVTELPFSSTRLYDVVKPNIFLMVPSVIKIIKLHRFWSFKKSMEIKIALWVQKLRKMFKLGGSGLFINFLWEGSAPAACTAGFFSFGTVSYTLAPHFIHLLSDQGLEDRMIGNRRTEKK